MSKFFLRYYIAITFLSIALLSCAQQKASANLPFELIDNRPVVAVKVNGKLLHFMFDTGAGNCIDIKVAQALQLQLSNPQQTMGAGDSSATAWNTRVDSLQVGPLSFYNAPLNVIPLWPIKEKLGLPYLDGIIGYTLMKDYIVQIDYPGKVIHLTNYYQPTTKAIPFKLRYGQTPQINVKINGVEATVIFDSGDRSFLTVRKHFTKKAGIRSSADTAITGYGIGGPVYAQRITIDSILIGDKLYKNVSSRIPVTTGGAFALTDIAGSIGSALVVNNKVTIDYKKNLFYIE